ncbi:hypothetical protein D5018_14465 [Parashewanella curva]|uniref:Uncharacterized protein n=1 Tax=Parashewanella curva TaxID=2338552 RepID=A0A3L8PUJ4_9GAMM|nr:hypothetical protein [Parashewanella curva]RLV58974.1 hypothetical protein D5018_14465 [Parashewanella curva]
MAAACPEKPSLAYSKCLTEIAGAYLRNPSAREFTLEIKQTHYALKPGMRSWSVKQQKDDKSGELFLKEAQEVASALNTPQLKSWFVVLKSISKIVTENKTPLDEKKQKIKKLSFSDPLHQYLVAVFASGNADISHFHFKGLELTLSRPSSFPTKAIVLTSAHRAFQDSELKQFEVKINSRQAQAWAFWLIAQHDIHLSRKSIKETKPEVINAPQAQLSEQVPQSPESDINDLFPPYNEEFTGFPTAPFMVTATPPPPYSKDAFTTPSAENVQQFAEKGANHTIEELKTKLKIFEKQIQQSLEQDLSISVYEKKMEELKKQIQQLIKSKPVNLEAAASLYTQLISLRENLQSKSQLLSMLPVQKQSAQQELLMLANTEMNHLEQLKNELTIDISHELNHLYQQTENNIPKALEQYKKTASKNADTVVQLLHSIRAQIVNLSCIDELMEHRKSAIIEHLNALSQGKKVTFVIHNNQQGAARITQVFNFNQIEQMMDHGLGLNPITMYPLQPNDIFVVVTE